MAAGTDDNASVAAIQVGPRSTAARAGSTRRPPPVRRPAQPWKLGLSASALVVALVGGVIVHNTRAPGAWYEGGEQAAPPPLVSSSVVATPQADESAPTTSPPRKPETPRVPSEPPDAVKPEPGQQRVAGPRPVRGANANKQARANATGRPRNLAGGSANTPKPDPKPKPRQSAGLNAQYVPSWELANEQPGPVAAAGNEERTAPAESDDGTQELSGSGGGTGRSAHENDSGTPKPPERSKAETSTTDGNAANEDGTAGNDKDDNQSQLPLVEDLSSEGQSE